MYATQDYWASTRCQKSRIQKKTTFGKLDQFPASGDGSGRDLLWANLNLWTPIISSVTLQTQI
jgi:hypothetical protein